MHVLASLVLGIGAIGQSSANAATVLTGYQTTGNLMDGMRVTVGYTAGGFETQIWGDTGRPRDNAGGAFGSSWSLTHSGDTFGFRDGQWWPWTLEVDSRRPIWALNIDAVPGNTVFDNISDATVTPGSADGRPFTVYGSGNGPNAVEYTVPIDISQGDLFGQLTLRWNQGFSGRLRFLADTDNGTNSNPVQIAPPPPPAPVPPPPPPAPVPPPPPTPVPPPPVMVIGPPALVGPPAIIDPPPPIMVVGPPALVGPPAIINPPPPIMIVDPPPPVVVNPPPLGTDPVLVGPPVPINPPPLDDPIVVGPPIDPKPPVFSGPPTPQSVPEPGFVAAIMGLGAIGIHRRRFK